MEDASGCHIDVCKQVFLGDGVREDDDWQQVKWQDWCRVVGTTLSNYYFPDVPLMRQYFWGRIDSNHNSMPIRPIAIGVMLAQDRCWLNLVRSLGRLLHFIISFPCGADLFRFIRRKACNLCLIDKQAMVSTLLQLGEGVMLLAVCFLRCLLWIMLIQHISSQRIQGGGGGVKIDLNSCHNKCRLLPLYFHCWLVL